MKIETKADELLDILYYMSRIIDKKDVRYSGIALEPEGEIMKVYASGTYGVSEAILNCIFDGTETSVIPITAIPFLSKLKGEKIELDIGSTKFNVSFGKNSLQLRQVAFRPEDIVKRKFDYNWHTDNTDGIKNIKYAAGDVGTGLDVLFVEGNKLITTDRIRFASCVLEQDLGSFTINKHVLSLIRDDVNLSVGDDFVFLGKDDLFTSTRTIDYRIPEALKTVANQEFKYMFLVDKDRLQRNVAIIKNMNAEDMVFNLSKERLFLNSKSATGVADIQQNIIDGFGETINLKLSTQLLHDAVSNCEDSHIAISCVGGENLPILALKSNTVVHYILPKVG